MLAIIDEPTPSCGSAIMIDFIRIDFFLNQLQFILRISASAAAVVTSSAPIFTVPTSTPNLDKKCAGGRGYVVVSPRCR